MPLSLQTVKACNAEVSCEVSSLGPSFSQRSEKLEMAVCESFGKLGDVLEDKVDTLSLHVGTVHAEC